MNWITGPNRAFGIGETKSQNAVIKVYSAAELKNALTKIYQLESGIGTIEIAGDITITEPIKLKQFYAPESQPREIIIQAASGARIINGNKAYGTSYNYGTVGNNNIPVFDLGTVLSNGYANIPVCKYTFKDLTINTTNSKPFGALVAANVKSSDTIDRIIGQISINNTKAINLFNIFGAYDTNSTPFAAGVQIIALNAKVNDFKWTNYDTSINIFNLNSPYFALQYSSITDIGILDVAKSISLSNLEFQINNSSNFDYNYIGYVFSQLIIANTISASSFGEGNIVVNCNISSKPTIDGFTYIGNNLNNNAVFPTTGSSRSFNIIGDDGTDNAVNSTYVVKNSVISFYPPDNSYYEVDFYLTVRYTVSQLVNQYHIKTAIKINSSGVGTVISNNTISAIEEVYTLLAVPFYDNVNKCLTLFPSDSGALGFGSNCTVVVNGSKLIT